MPEFVNERSVKVSVIVVVRVVRITVIRGEIGCRTKIPLTRYAKLKALDALKIETDRCIDRPEFGRTDEYCTNTSADIADGQQLGDAIAVRGPEF